MVNSDGEGPAESTSSGANASGRQSSAMDLPALRSPRDRDYDYRSVVERMCTMKCAPSSPGWERDLARRAKARGTATQSMNTELDMLMAAKAGAAAGGAALPPRPASARSARSEAARYDPSDPNSRDLWARHQTQHLSSTMQDPTSLLIRQLVHTVTTERPLRASPTNVGGGSAGGSTGGALVSANAANAARVAR